MNDHKFQVRFGALAIPAGVTPRGRLKLSLCFTPRLVEISGPHSLPVKGLEQAFTEAMEIFIKEGIGVGTNSLREKLAGQVQIKFNDQPQPVPCWIDGRWRAIWNQAGGEKLRRKIWTQLLATAQAGLWEDALDAPKARQVPREKTQNADELVRSGHPTLEAPGLGTLGTEVRQSYVRIADQLARAAENPEDARIGLEAAHREFSGVARSLEAQLDRLSHHGSVSESSATAAASRNSGMGGTADTPPDTFHPVFPRLQPYRSLQQFLGLIVDVEVEVPSWLPRKAFTIQVDEEAIQTQPPGSDAWLNCGLSNCLVSATVVLKDNKPVRFTLESRQETVDLSQHAWLPFDALGLAMQSLSARRKPEDKTRPLPAAPPPLRNAGLSLVVRDKDDAGRAAGRAKEAEEVLNAGTEKLLSKQLLVGEAVELRPAARRSLSEKRYADDEPWLSLCERQNILEIRSGQKNVAPLRLWWRQRGRVANQKRELVWVEDMELPTDKEVRQGTATPPPPPPAGDVAHEIVALSMALSQSPQPLTGVVLALLDANARTARLAVATPLGDWIVEHSGEHMEDFKKLRGEYRFTGALALSSEKTDYLLVAVGWERLGDARAGRLLKAENPGEEKKHEKDALFVLETFVHDGAALVREAAKIARVPAPPPTAARPLEGDVPHDYFPLVLSAPWPRSELKDYVKADKAMNIVTPGARALAGAETKLDGFEAKVVRIVRVEPRGADFAIIVATEDFGEFPLLARPNEFSISGLNAQKPEEPSKNPLDLPQHGQAWMEVVSFVGGRVQDAWLLGETKELIVDRIERTRGQDSADKIVFTEVAAWHVEHVAREKKTGAKDSKDSSLELRIHLARLPKESELSDLALAPVTVSGLAAVAEELIPGERVTARGRQMTDQFVPVHLVRARGNQAETLAMAVAVAARDEETFQVRLATDEGAWAGKTRQWKFMPGPRAVLPRLGELLWIKEPDKNAADSRVPFTPATAVGSTEQTFWGRTVKQGTGVVTSRGLIPFGASSRLPEGTAVLVSITSNHSGIQAQVLKHRAAGVVLEHQTEGRFFGPLSGEIRFDQNLLLATNHALGEVVAIESGGAGKNLSVKPARPILRILEAPGPEPTLRVRMLGWRVADGHDLEPLAQPVDIDLDMEGWSAEVRASLQPDHLVELTKATARFRVARPENTLLRCDEFEQALMVDSSVSVWRTMRLWAEAKPSTRKFDLILLGFHPEEFGVFSLANYRVGGADTKLTLHSNEPVLSAPEAVRRLPTEDQMFVSDAVFTWNHWSLVAPNPILKTADEPATAAPTDAQGPDIRCVGEPPPGNLVPMRYGRKYDVRVRDVDMAGNISRSDNAGAVTCAPDKSVTCLRYDALGAPLAVPVSEENVLTGPQARLPVPHAGPAAPDDQQEETEIILRSRWQDGRYEPVKEFRERSWLLLPPPAGLDVLLSHGVLDGAEDKAFAALEEIRLMAERAPAGQFHYRLRPGILPYARDPLARRLAVLVTGSWSKENSSGRENLVLLRLAGNWPRVTAVVLTVQAGTEKNPRTRTRGENLLVFLPPGEVCNAAISAAPNEDDWPLLGWSDPESLPKDDRWKEIRKLMLQGRHSLVSGVRHVRLMHAVDRPAAPPVIESMREVGLRGLGSQSVSYCCRVGFDPKTTGCITLHAEWDEYVDHPDRRYPSVPPEEAARCFDPLAEDMSAEEMKIFIDAIIAWRRQPGTSDWVLHFGLDHANLLPRFSKNREWFWKALREFATPSVGTATLLDKPFSRPEPGVVPPERHFDFVHTFDDSRHRRVDYRARAFTCFAREFPDGPPVGSVAATPVSVLSTAPPAAPEVAYVVPLFGHEDDASPALVSGEPRRRKGMALRIYLRRPWYSSGAGEELAVIFSPHERPERALRERVTEWGYDPAWYGPEDRGNKLPQPRADWCLWSTARELVPVPRPVVPGGAPWQVEAAAHAVRFSPVRGLWYCDVLFRDDVPMPQWNGGARPYLPFLRLALARYQVNAISAARLSEIVSLEFIQLHPSRTLVAKRTGPWTLHCTVTGPMPTGDHDRTRRRIEATVQRSQRDNPESFAEAVLPGEWQPLERDEKQGQSFYAGDVELPRTQGQPLELIVRECELIDTAEAAAQPRTIYAERVLIAP